MSGLDDWVDQALGGVPPDEQVRRLRRALAALGAERPAEVALWRDRAAMLEQRLDRLGTRLALAERVCRRAAAREAVPRSELDAWRHAAATLTLDEGAA